MKIKISTDSFVKRCAKIAVASIVVTGVTAIVAKHIMALREECPCIIKGASYDEDPCACQENCSCSSKEDAASEIPNEEKDDEEDLKEDTASEIPNEEKDSEEEIKEAEPEQKKEEKAKADLFDDLVHEFHNIH